MLVFLCVCSGIVSRQEFRLILNKLNRMDDKLDYLCRKINSVCNKTGSGEGVAVPAVPNGMTVPADTVKDLKAVASMVSDEHVRKQLASITLDI